MHAGARLRGPVLGLTLDGRLWIGTGPAMDPETRTWRASLTALDPATGVAEEYEKLLPVMEYNVGGVMETVPAATAGVVVLENRVIVVSRAGLLEIAGGALTVREVRVGGEAILPTGAAMASGEALWVTHEGGISLINIDDFRVIRTWGAPELGDAWTHSPAPAPDGSVFFLRVDNASGVGSLAHLNMERVRMVHPADVGAPDGSFTALVARPDRVEAYAAAASWQPAAPALFVWSGEGDPRVLATESDLGDGEGAFDVFGPIRLALDPRQDVLAVGGAIRSSLTGFMGGGFLWMRISDGSMVRLSPANSPFFAVHSGPIVMDPENGVTYAAVLSPCSDVQLAHLGLFAFSFDAGGNLVVGRPLVSGVRALAADREGHLWAGLRDDNPGYSCDGLPITTGFYEIHGNGWGRWEKLSLKNGEYFPVQLPSVTAAARNGDGAWALGTWRDGLLTGVLDALTMANNAIDWRASVYNTSVFWESPRVLWVAGLSSHSPGDPPQLADAGPMGALRLALDDAGAVVDYTHFVARLRPDLRDEHVVEGLPSGEIMQVLPLSDGRVLLVCAAERMMPAGSDHAPRAFFEDENGVRHGGLAAVDPETGAIEILAAAPDLGDPQAAVELEPGRLLVLDAAAGAVEVRNGRVTPWPGAMPAGFPRAVLLLKDDPVFLTGAYARVPGLPEDIAGAFYSGVVLNSSLYLGGLEGVREIFRTGTRVALPAYPPFGPIPFR